MTSNIGSNIRSLRQLEGISMQQLADAIGRTRQAVSAYEKGEINPSVETLNRIASFFNVSVSSIVFDADAEAAKYGITRSTIPPDEYELLMCYRAMSNRLRTLLIETARAYRESTALSANGEVQ